jgi:ADP-ribose pyrophosphatase YjhB (NUDIX family)
MIPAPLARLAYRVAYVGLRVWSRVAHPHTRGVKCVICAGDRILLVRHSYGPRTWDLPGGFARRGESFLDTARRELGEELTLGAAGPPAQFASFERDFVGRHEHLGAVRIDVAGPEVEIRGFEVAETGWFRRDELPQPRAEVVDLILSLEPGLPESGGG